MQDAIQSCSKFKCIYKGLYTLLSALWSVNKKYLAKIYYSESVNM